MSEEVEKCILKINVTRFTGAEYARSVHVVTAEQKMPASRFSEADAWANIANRLNVGDFVEVTADDGTWWAEFLIRAVGHNWASAKMLRYVPLSTSDVEQTKAGMDYDDFFIENRGAHVKWRVVRKSDKANIKEGCQTREIAMEWLTQHLKATA